MVRDDTLNRFASNRRTQSRASWQFRLKIYHAAFQETVPPYCDNDVFTIRRIQRRAVETGPLDSQDLSRPSIGRGSARAIMGESGATGAFDDVHIGDGLDKSPDEEVWVAEVEGKR
jgi:hypothetical protein